MIELSPVNKAKNNVFNYHGLAELSNAYPAYLYICSIFSFFLLILFRVGADGKSI